MTQHTKRTRLALCGGMAVATLATSLAFSPFAHKNEDTHPVAAQVVSTATHAHYTASQAVESVAPVTYNSSYNDAYVSIARQAAAEAGIGQERFVRQINQESGFNPNAVSPAGAIGIAQFMPGTAAAMGVNPHDPTSSLHGAARHMAGLSRTYGGDYAKALAAYNAGPGTVNGAVSRGGANWLAYTPDETQQYVNTIM